MIPRWPSKPSAPAARLKTVWPAFFMHGDLRVPRREASEPTLNLPPKRRSAAKKSAVPVAAEKKSLALGPSPSMRALSQDIEKVAATPASVLIVGESGTGKELVARAIHEYSKRHGQPFVPVNCGAIPASLIEAELFGHEKGAFTGAVGQSIGRFEQAQGGTLFLDEIGDMPMHAQTRLLRALQSGVISRIGGKASIRLDVRIVAATNQNLATLIEKGGFREDLFYRLNVVPIEMPPLRDRTEDIGLLAQHFLMMAAKDGLPMRKIDDGAVAQLMAMPWRGNIRELKNLIYRLALLCREDTITESTIHQFVEPAHDVDPPIQGASFEAAVAQFLRDQRQRGNLREKLYPRALAQFEIPLLQHVMKQVKGNQLKAAALLGINRNTLRKKLTDYGIGPAGGR